MSNDVYGIALNSALNEIKIAGPEVSHTFIFKENAQIVTTDETTDKKTATKAAAAIHELLERSTVLGGIETLTFYGTNERANVACLDDIFLATVATKESDEKYLNTLTRVLVPTVLKIAEKIKLTPIEGTEPEADAPEIEMPEVPEAPEIDVTEEATNDEVETLNEETSNPLEETHDEESEEITEEPAEEIPERIINEPIIKEPIIHERSINEPLINELTMEEEEPEPELEEYVPDPPVTQFMIENLGGLLVPPDTVRIDNAVILQWKDLYPNREITEVDLETLNGQTTRCKFKPIKDSKLEEKGVIQMPEKIKRLLQTSKGELVMVKPVIESESSGGDDDSA